MLKVRRIGMFSVLAGVLLIGGLALPVNASTVRFGAKLTSSTQPQDATTCSNAISGSVPSGGVCTWVATTAFENGSHFKAPQTGTVTKLKLVSCDSGKFTLQMVKINGQGKVKAIKNGPQISYHADPRQIDGDPNTFCGGDNGDDYLIQTFSIHVAVQQGEYIAVKASKVGTLHCSGSNMPLYYPALSTGQGYRTKTGGTGCDLLVSLQY